MFCGAGERTLGQGTLVIIFPGAKEPPLSSHSDQVKLGGEPVPWF